MGNNPYKWNMFHAQSCMVGGDQSGFASSILDSKLCWGKAWIGWWLWIHAIKAVGRKTELAIWSTGDCLKLLTCCGWARGEGDWPKTVRCHFILRIFTSVPICKAGRRVQCLCKTQWRPLTTLVSNQLAFQGFLFLSVCWMEPERALLNNRPISSKCWREKSMQNLVAQELLHT